MSNNQTYLTVTFVTIFTFCAIMLTWAAFSRTHNCYNEHDRYLQKLRFDKINVYLDATNNNR